ncbi:MAG: hypothetical protein CMG13_06510 [Candidatus Marinimicrobia bacterium]|nr:hypothetical protein [Candidatus Neomarinimicrobiota bacterium]
MMRNIFLITVIFFTVGLSANAGIGSVTIDGKIYNQLAFRPDYNFGKFGLGLDLYFYIDDEGKFYEKTWDFSGNNAVETLLDKVRYLSYGKPSDRFYFRVGNMPSVTLGYGILVNNYSNTIEYPDIRRLGLDIRTNSRAMSTQFIHSDLKRADQAGLVAFRATFPLAPRLKIGVFLAADPDLTKGLVDSDDDGYPDYFDHSPDDENSYSRAQDTYEGSSSTYDAACISEGFDTDGSTTLSQDELNACLGGTDPGFNLDVNDFVPGATLSKESVTGAGIDMSLILTRKITLYSQFAQLMMDKEGAGSKLFDTDGINNYEESLGWGAIPIGLGFSFGPEKFKISTNLEYRLNSRHFMFGFWDQSYELNRASVISDTAIRTRTNSLLNYGELNGVFFGMNMSMLNFMILDVSYQHMSGETWVNDGSVTFSAENGYFKEDEESKSLLAKLSLNVSKIPKLKIAEVYYERTNDTSFDLSEPSLNTIHGYNIGYEFSEGVVLLYKGRTTYVTDIGNLGKLKSNFSLQFETQIAL